MKKIILNSEFFCKQYESMQRNLGHLFYSVNIMMFVDLIFVYCLYIWVLCVCLLSDTGVNTLSRHILLDPIMMFFIMAATYALLKFLSFRERWITITVYIIALSKRLVTCGKRNVVYIIEWSNSWVKNIRPVMLPVKFDKYRCESVTCIAYFHQLYTFPW